MPKNKWEEVRYNYYALVSPGGEILAEVIKGYDFWKFNGREFMEQKQAQAAAESYVSGVRRISVRSAVTPSPETE